jgi:drug/metabolite transporter superfamily protein YnfA
MSIANVLINAIILAVAIGLNLIAIYCMKVIRGWQDWPLIVLGSITIVATQALIAIAAKVTGGLGPAIAFVVVAVIVGAIFIDHRVDAVWPSRLQWAGYAIALVGVLVVQAAQAWQK